MKNFILIVSALVIGMPQGFAKDSSQPSALKLALNWVPEPEFGGFYAAEMNGFYKKHGLQVDIIIGGAGSPTIQMVAAKKVDFAITSGNEVIISRARGADVLSVFAVYQKSPLMIMAHRSRKLNSLKEVFESGTLAIERGQSFASFLERKFGFSKVKIVPYAGGIANFLHDPLFAQQGFATAEALLAKQAGAEPQVFLLADEGFNPYMENITINASLLKSKPETVKAFVAASREGWIEYLKNPDPTNKLMSTLNKSMDAKTFKEAADAQVPFIQDALTQKNGLGFMTESRWKEQADLLLSLKDIPKTLPASEYFRSF
jgi:NitT/TauT family transport system substrate-binding protein